MKRYSTSLTRKWKLSHSEPLPPTVLAKEGKDMTFQIKAGENEGQSELCSAAGGSVNWYNYFGKVFISVKAEYTHTLLHSCFTSNYIPSRNAFMDTAITCSRISRAGLFVIYLKGILPKYPKLVE